MAQPNIDDRKQQNLKYKDVLGLLLQTLNEIIEVAPSIQSASSHANFTARIQESE